MPFDLDDPRLTAYALGELDPTDRAEIEAHVTENPEARRLVAEIQATAALLTEHFRLEPADGLAPEHHQTIETQLRRRPLWKPAVALIGIASAAGLLLIVGPRATRSRQAAESARLRAARPTEEVAPAYGELPHDDASVVAIQNAPSKAGSVQPGWKPDDRIGPMGYARNSGRNTQLADGSVVMESSPRTEPTAPATPAEGMSFGQVAQNVPALKEAAPAPFRTHGGLGPGDEDRSYRDPIALSARPAPASQAAAPVPADQSRISRSVSAGERGIPGSVPEATSALRGHNLKRDMAQDQAAPRPARVQDRNSLGSKGKGVALGVVPDREPTRRHAPGVTSFNGGPANVQTGQAPQQFGSQQGMPQAALPDEIRQNPSKAKQQQQGQSARIDKGPALLKRVDELQAANVAQANRIAALENKLAHPALEPATEMTIADQIRLAPPAEEPSPPEAPQGGEEFAQTTELPFVSTAEDRLSTFSIDVDTASFANVRRYLVQGGRPPKDAVRVEEMVNYFRYDYPQPKGKVPFSVNVEIARSPWNADHRLARIGLRGKDVDLNNRPPSNLVFLLDVSGSMAPANKLPLAKAAMKMLVERLGENDRIAVVVYAGRVGLALPSTPGSQQGEILSVIDQLHAGGSTNGGDGLRTAYEVARANFIKGGVNRVILCTDGDFNVGPSSDEAMFKLIEQERRSKVFLSTLGFGMGNLKDSKLEGLADKGNGNYHYIDDLAEARKVLVEEMGGTLVTIAKDVKIQVEFNPEQVARFRLIGYENRVMAHQDFRDDARDAGEIGAGHTVTALYELVPAEKAPSNQPSLTVRLRYKQPEGDVSEKEIERPIRDGGKDYAAASPDFKFASAVAGFAMILRDSPYRGSLTLAGVKELAQAGLGRDSTGYRKQFVELVERAQTIWAR